MPRSAIFCLLIFALSVALAASPAYAQKRTIILVRHAEKDSTSGADANDPALSPEGRTRAENLAKRIKGYRVGAVYSSNYRRTRETVDPVAKRRKKEIKIYDPRNQQALVNEIMSSKTKRFLVVGHSNTVPALVNLLIKKELFKNLEETEYGTIWVVELRNGRSPEIRVLTY